MADAKEPAERSARDIFGGGAKPRDTREKILFAAIDLFYVHGIHEVGVDLVCDTAGVTKTTFYNHFESRDHLILEALALRDAWEGALVEKRLREIAGYDPRALLVGYFDVLDELFNHPRYEGCLFVLACAQYPSPKHPIHRAAAKSFTGAEEAFRGLAKAAGVPDPVAFGATCTMLLEGALTRRLVSGDNGAARAARAVVERMLAAELGGAATAGGPDPAVRPAQRSK
jgi:AcrR family transcriptional regulator